MERFILFTATIFAAMISSNFNAEARSAILVAHYGSSDDNTRIATIDKITADIRSEFPSMEVREAYISPAVRNNLTQRGISTDSPTEALMRLRIEGFDTVYVQSTTIIDGMEMAEVHKSAQDMAPFFSLIKVGNSLLHSPDDCLELVGILSDYPCENGQAIVYVGHGNNLPSTATYAQLDYMLTIEGPASFHVSTIEGYPTAQTTLNELKRDKKIKTVTLLPLLLVCGNHTKNDIAGEFADVLDKAGYRVNVVMRGLAEVAAVRRLYVEKTRRLLTLP